MAYGTVKVDNITFDNGGSDQNVTVSGLYRATTSGVTLSGTIAATTVSGVTVIGGTTVSGATVTGTTANFTSGNFGNIISSAATMSGALIMANQQQVRFREAVGNGVNHIALQAPAIVSADQTITLPDQTGTVITTGDNGSVSSTMLATNLTISAAAGSASAPSIAFTGDTNTGIYSPGADQVAISTNGSASLSIDSIGNINVNRGSLVLSAVGPEGGELKLQNPTNTGTVYHLDANTATNARLFTTSNNTNLQIGQLEGTGGLITFHTSTTERLRIDSSGKVGIGTSAPNYQLHVTTDFAVGASGFNQQLSFTNDTIQSLLLGTGYTALKLNPLGGNVGINTSTPTSQLEVIGSIKGVAGSFGLFASNGSGTGQTSIGLRREGAPTDQKTWEILNASSGEFLIRTISDSYASSQDVFSVYRGSGVGVDNVRLHTSGSERLRIDGVGNVGIGTSSPNYTLDLNSGGVTPAQISTTVNWNFPGFILRRNASNVSTAKMLGMMLQGDTDSDTTLTNHLNIWGTYSAAPTTGSTTAGLSGVMNLGAPSGIALHVNGSERGRIDSSGNVGIGTNAPIQKLSVHGIASDTIDETTGVCKFQDNGGNGLLFGTRASSPYQSYIQSAYVADTSVAQYQLLLNPLGADVAIGTTAPLSTFHIAATGECKLIIGNEQTNTDGLKRSAIIKKADNNLEIRATESTVASETIFTRTASVESARIDSSGRLLVGTSTSRSNWANQTGTDPIFQIEKNGDARASIVRTSANEFGPQFWFGKTRGTAYQIVSSADPLGEISFMGADGTELVSAAAITAFVDGTPGANDMPGRLVFSTTADGAASPTERMRIKSNGTINFSNVATYADNTAALAGGLVAGDVYRKSDGTLMITY